MHSTCKMSFAIHDGEPRVLIAAPRHRRMKCDNALLSFSILILGIPFQVIYESRRHNNEVDSERNENASKYRPKKPHPES